MILVLLQHLQKMMLRNNEDSGACTDVAVIKWRNIWFIWQKRVKIKSDSVSILNISNAFKHEMSQSKTSNTILIK